MTRLHKKIKKKKKKKVRWKREKISETGVELTTFNNI